MRRLSSTTLLLARCALLASCATTQATTTPESVSFGLPAVRAPLEFPPDTHEVTLGWLVDELARLSGQELTLNAQLRKELDTTIEPLEVTSPVPAREVYAYVEAMLSVHSVLLAPAKGGERHVLGVYGAPSGVGEARAVVVEPQQVAGLADHPALLCQILLTFENIDSRQLQTQLRQLLVDSGGTLQVVPAGDRGLLLKGSGAKLLGLVQLLREVDRASAPRQLALAEPSKPDSARH